MEGGEGTVCSGSALDHFAESEELMSLVSSLPQVYSELRSREKSEERFTSESGPPQLVHLYDCAFPYRHSGQVSGAATPAGPLLRYDYLMCTLEAL